MKLSSSPTPGPPTSPHSPAGCFDLLKSSLVGNSHRCAHYNRISATVLTIIYVPLPWWPKESIMISSVSTWCATLEPSAWCCYKMCLCWEAKWVCCHCREGSKGCQRCDQQWFPSTTLKGRRKHQEADQWFLFQVISFRLFFDSSR